jgi:hypothetical protein
MEPVTAFSEVTPRLDLKFGMQFETTFRMKLGMKRVMAVSNFVDTFVLQQKNPTFTV